MGDLLVVDFSGTAEVLPSAPPELDGYDLPSPTPSQSARWAADALGEGGIDWDAETVGPLTRPAVVPTKKSETAGRPAGAVLPFGSGGQRD